MSWWIRKAVCVHVLCTFMNGQIQVMVVVVWPNQSDSKFWLKESVIGYIVVQTSLIMLSLWPRLFLLKSLLVATCNMEIGQVCSWHMQWYQGQHCEIYMYLVSHFGHDIVALRKYQQWQDSWGCTHWDTCAKFLDFIQPAPFYTWTENSRICSVLDSRSYTITFCIQIELTGW